ncbi:hypothetical protein ACFXGI_06150 [Streptomyces sp. NPDC059355]
METKPEQSWRYRPPVWPSAYQLYGASRPFELYGTDWLTQACALFST